jgi:hypothetical protein
MMSNESKIQQPKIESLELNKEVLQDLGDAESEQAKGGAKTMPGSLICHTVIDTAVPGATCACFSKGC